MRWQGLFPPCHRMVIACFFVTRQGQALRALRGLDPAQACGRSMTKNSCRRLASNLCKWKVAKPHASSCWATGQGAPTPKVLGGRRPTEGGDCATRAKRREDGGSGTLPAQWFWFACCGQEFVIYKKDVCRARVTGIQARSGIAFQRNCVPEVTIVACLK